MSAFRITLSMGFLSGEYWNGLLFPSPELFHQPRDRTHISCSKHIFTTDIRPFNLVWGTLKRNILLIHVFGWFLTISVTFHYTSRNTKFHSSVLPHLQPLHRLSFLIHSYFVLDQVALLGRLARSTFSASTGLGWWPAFDTPKRCAPSIVYPQIVL